MTSDTSATSPNAKLLLALAALMWSSGGLLIKWISVGPLMVAGMRSLIAGVVIFALFRPRLFPLKISQMMGALTYALTLIFFVIATKWTSAANAILLQSTAPIYIALFGGVFLKEKTKPIDIATIAVVFIGMLFFFRGEISLQGFRGNLLGLVSGFTFAWFILITRKYSHHSPITMIVVGNFLAATLTLPFALGSSSPSHGDWAGLLALGIFQLAIPYVLYTKAIAFVPVIDAVLLVLIEPILNPIWVFIFLAERPGFWSLVGGIIVLGAVTLRSLILSQRVPAA